MGAAIFHAGELAAQERVGVREQMDAVGRNNVRDRMPQQHRDFFAQLPFLFIGALDAGDQPWATVLAGTPGFVSTPDARTLRIDAGVMPGDALDGQLTAGGHIGALGLEPTTRRRNRVNGVIDVLDARGLSIAVRQSFGNCPQYIQSRAHHRHAPAAGAAPRVLLADRLSDADRALIARADTFFIASANVDPAAGGGRGVDLSHRGGRPGFVRVDDDRTLTVPDFVGNFFFNTIGNLLAHPAAGLLFIDFDSGDLLQLAVDGEVVWDGPEVQAFAGAERLLRLRVRQVRRNAGALPLRWSAPQQSPVLARTGTWGDAEQALAATRLARAWRPFTVAAIRDESATIRSFYLRPADGLGLAPFEPGQFLPLRVTLPGQDRPGHDGPGHDGPGHDWPVVRNYTLSDAPNTRHYRISVKRDGAVSRSMHDHLKVGDEVEAMGPAGTFIFDGSGQRPVVMLSAGVGVTPMMAMLNSLLVNNGRTRHAHPIYFIHGARNRQEHAFFDDVRALAARHWNLHAHVRYSEAGADIGDEDEVVRFQRSAGRVDMALLRQLLPFDDYDFYLCGPAAFMQTMHDGLRALNVAPGRIRFEAFGPATVRTAANVTEIANTAAKTDAKTDANTGTTPAAQRSSQADGAIGVPVSFARSGVAAHWDGNHTSLLELAEALDLAPPSGCRSGLCGACAAPLLAGQVDAIRHCAASAPDGQMLLCSTRPRAPDPGATASGIVIDL
jgi:ferredoxin-NADP reductase/predicted pyridoxine 5'-phosphate oxidase superfamily flavin-nucleotide-binding protein/ferredoxin